MVMGKLVRPADDRQTSTGTGIRIDSYSIIQYVRTRVPNLVHRGGGAKDRYLNFISNFGYYGGDESYFVMIYTRYIHTNICNDIHTTFIYNQSSNY
eukprot:SAG31_NODE_94_length_26208_cov_6.281091_12_plen_96_part_00